MVVLRFPITLGLGGFLPVFGEHDGLGQKKDDAALRDRRVRDLDERLFHLLAGLDGREGVRRDGTLCHLDAFDDGRVIAKAFEVTLHVASLGVELSPDRNLFSFLKSISLLVFPFECDG